MRAYMLLVPAVCMVTERGGWGPWKRVRFTVLAWALSVFVCVPAGVIITLFVDASLPWVLTHAFVLVSTLPVVVWEMWHSRLFVAEARVDPELGSTLGDDAEAAA